MTTLGNALRLLSTIGESRPQLRVSHAARELGLPKSTVSRLVKELTVAGFLEAEPTGGVRCGPELFRLGALYRMRLPAEAWIDEALGEMIHRYRATAYIGILRGMDLLVLRRHESSFPVRFIQEPGALIPAFATAVGKALLARLPDEEIVASLPQQLAAEQRGDKQTRDELRAELAQVRRRGFAELDNTFLGVAAIGAAVRIAPQRDLGFAICFARDNTDQAQRDAMASEICAIVQRVGALCQDPAWI